MAVRFDKYPTVDDKCRFSCNYVMVVVWAHCARSLQRPIKNLPSPSYDRTPNKSCRVLHIYTNAMSCTVTSSVIMCSSQRQGRPSCLILAVVSALALRCSTLVMRVEIIMVGVVVVITTTTKIKVCTRHWRAHRSLLHQRWCRTMVDIPLRRIFDRLVVLSLSY